MKVCKLKLTEKAPTWKGGGIVERVNSCRAMLYLHGFLTDAESAKVKQRMEKWIVSSEPTGSIKHSEGSQS